MRTAKIGPDLRLNSAKLGCKVTVTRPIACRIGAIFSRCFWTFLIFVSNWESSCKRCSFKHLCHSSTWSCRKYWLLEAFNEKWSKSDWYTARLGFLFAVVVAFFVLVFIEFYSCFCDIMTNFVPIDGNKNWYIAETRIEPSRIKVSASCWHFYTARLSYPCQRSISAWLLFS